MLRLLNTLLLLMSVTSLFGQTDPYRCSFVLCAREFYVNADFNMPKFINSNDFRVSDQEAIGTSTVDYSPSNNPFSLRNSIISPMTGQIDQIRRELDPQLIRLATEFKDNLRLFDLRNFDAAKNIKEMELEIQAGIKTPKVLESFQKSMEEYKKLESLSRRFFDYSHQPGGVPMVNIGRKSGEFMNEQLEILKKGDRHFLAGEEIIWYSKNENSLRTGAKKEINTKNRLSEANAAKLKKIKSDIAFAQKQIKSLMKGETELRKIDEVTRSQVLAISGNIATALKSTADLVYETLSAISDNSGLLTGVDIGKAFLEKLMEQNLANGIPLEKAVKTAFEAAYYEAVIHASSSEKFPLDKLAVIPKKILAIVENISLWNELNENQRTLNKTIKEQLDFVNDAIKRNEKLIQKSNVEADKLIKKTSRDFLKKPFSSNP